MDPVDWIIPSLVAAAGVAAGITFGLRGGSGSSPNQASDLARREDLLREKERLIRAIREFQDTDDRRQDDDSGESLQALELAAAKVLRDLEGHRMSDEDTPSNETSKPEPAASDAGGLSAEARGMLKGAALVAFGALLIFALGRGSTQRTGDMQITGKAPEVSEIARQGPVPAPGQPGGEVADVPPALKPKPSARVDRARARVGQQQEDPQAWAELGYALLDAEGWIDAFQTAQTLQELAPGEPDGLVIEAMVRVPMGQADQARSLLDKALEADPDHVMALTARGMLRYSSGDREGSVEDWSKARALAGPDQGHDDLLAMARGEAPVAPAIPQGTPMPPGHPSTTASAAATATGGSGKPVTGSLKLGAGVSRPSQGVVFLYARNPGQKAGPPVAVKRLEATAVPGTFSLGPADQMMAGMPFPERIDLSARWDLDGNAMTKEAGDLVAEVPDVTAGSSGLSLELRPR